MGTKTGISWTEATWNPIRGCLRVSEGCRFCYAESIAARFNKPGEPYDGLANFVTTPRGTEPRWTGEVMLVEDHLEDPIRWRKSRMIFVNSTSDFFFEKIPVEYLDRMMAVMALAQHHTYQVLTKRADRLKAYLSDPAMPARVLEAVMAIARTLPATWNGNVFQAEEYLVDRKGVLPHVWWGVSAEDQATANVRVPLLLSTPAAVRWVSYEPALGWIDFERIVERESDPEAYWYIDALRGNLWDDANGTVSRGGLDVPALDWIVIGGESHKQADRARPFSLGWPEILVRQSQGDGVRTAIFVKQLGSNPVDSEGSRVKYPGKADVLEDFPEAIRVQNYPEAADAHPS